jgi:ABC-type Fe3+-hydroxamate transport system substrate-binding protein
VRTWLAIAWLALGCTRAAEPPATLRIASLSPAITETLASWQVLDQVIARSDYCQFPSSVTGLPAAGTALTPDLERLARLRPSHVLLDESVGSRVDEIRKLTRVETYPWLTVEEIARSTRRLGDLVGRAEQASTLADDLIQTLTVQPPAHAPRVLAVLGGGNLQDGEIWFVRPDSLHGAALHAAGVRNAIEHDITGPPSMSIESVIRLDPDIVLILDASAIDRSEMIVGQWRRLTTLKAVRTEQIAVVSGADVMSTGPTILATVDRLRTAIHALSPADEP